MRNLNSINPDCIILASQFFKNGGAKLTNLYHKIYNVFSKTEYNTHLSHRILNVNPFTTIIEKDLVQGNFLVV